MKDNLTELVFILDRSGSMGGLEGDTIGGYNSFIGKQKAEDGEAFLSTVLFDDRFEVIHNRVDIKSVKPLTDKEYFVRGSTALLDSIGRGIDAIGIKLKGTPEAERPAKVLFVITTDGMENASREYSAKRVKEMIQHQTDKYGWEFLFLGANIDAIGVAQNMGIRAERAVRYNNDSRGVEMNYCVMSDAVSGFRRSKKIDDKWKAEIEEDYAERGEKK
ncbi:VWA domain-containing protein [bacterium]|nr:VWA domain-containing protein [bacterium]